MTMTTISVISLLALLFSICTVTFSILAFCKVVGLENSTHKIQYMPMDEFKEMVPEEEEDLPMGMPTGMSEAEKKEKKRIERLGENFGQMYEDKL